MKRTTDGDKGDCNDDDRGDAAAVLGTDSDGIDG